MRSFSLTSEFYVSYTDFRTYFGIYRLLLFRRYFEWIRTARGPKYLLTFLHSWAIYIKFSIGECLFEKI
jgi:hypothetical protein